MSFKDIQIADDDKKTIDDWLQDMPDEDIPDLQKAAEVLKEDLKICGDAPFVIDFDEFKRKKLSNERVESILTNLYRVDVIAVFTRHKDNHPAAVKNYWDEPWQYLDKVKLTNNTLVAIDVVRFPYLYFKLEEKTNDRNVAARNFNWESKPDEHKGVLTVPSEEPLTLKSSYFGGVNVFFQDENLSTSLDNLKKGIAEHLQGRKKSKNEIVVSVWKSEFKRDHSKFFELFEIRGPSPTKIYRLIQKS